MDSPGPEKPRFDDEKFLRALMRRQLKLSLKCAAIFLVALLGLPLANYFLPELMALRVFGFTLTWLLLGILFLPFVWMISLIFIRRSIILEETQTNEFSHRDPEARSEVRK